MCKQGEYAAVRLRGGIMIRTIDLCIAPLVQALNTAGFDTKQSCCGHGNICGSIVLTDGREILIAQNYQEARRMEQASKLIRIKR